MSKLAAVPPESFYGAPTAQQVKVDAIIRKNQAKKTQHFELPKCMKQLLGPSKTWKVFKKQQDALDACLKRRNDLMCFAFEQNNGERLFLVAHPKVFWTVDSSNFRKNRSSYEVIREFSVCKLYLDIEFEIEYNKSNVGERMLKNFLKIINNNLKIHFKVDCSENDLLDLDSSTEEKFSHHVIYQIKNTAFQNNYVVGNFIKMICSELKEAFNNEEKIKELSQKYGLEDKEIHELFVKDGKDKIKIFVDEGVYTKNRHFRLLGSSKVHKNVPLVVSLNNKYKPEENKNEVPNCNLFLDSLITYFSSPINKVLEFGEFDKKIKNVESNVNRTPRLAVGKCNETSYPEIDKFIENLIFPKGRIRRKFFFSSSFVVVYDISSYRFCHNIGREHKSNNIKFVVNLNQLTYHQKCYDPDCGDFKSNEFKLPPEICFLYEDDFDFKEDDLLFNDNDLFDEDLIRAAELLEIKTELFADDDMELDEVTGCIEDFLNESDKDFHEP